MPVFAQYPLVARVKGAFDRLEPRERWFVVVGAVVVGGFLLLQLVISPYLEARHRLALSVAGKKADLRKIEQLQREYRRLHGTPGGAGAKMQEEGFSLFSFIEEQAAQAKIKQQIVSMRPSAGEAEERGRESVVEMKLQKISLPRLVEFLRRIEVPERAVVIRHISIQDGGEGGLDVLMQIAAGRKA